MKKKRIIAVTAAALLGITAAPTQVFAADSYQAAEKAALTRALERCSVNYAKSLERSGKIPAGYDGTWTIRLEDAGRALLTALTPTDLSWLNQVNLNLRISFQNGDMAELADVFLNDSKICSLELYSDFENGVVYEKLPELSDAYLKVDYNSLNTTEPSGETSVSSLKSMNDLSRFLIGFSETLPPADTVTSLLDKYASILIECPTGGAGSPETLSVSAVSEECTVIEGRISQAEAIPTMKKFLTTARDDAQLKELIDTYSQSRPEHETVYRDFQKKIDEMLADLTKKPDSTDTSFFTSKIWINKEGNIVGRQLLLTEDSTAQPLITWQAPSDGTSRGLLLEFGSEDSLVTLTGSRAENNGLSDGIYQIRLNSDPWINVEMTDYDAAASESGLLNGKYSLSLLPGIGDEETYNMLNSFTLDLDCQSAEEASAFTLTLSSAGVPLLSNILTAAPGEPVEIPDSAGFETVYDVSSEEDMQAFSSALNLEPLFTNMLEAGMPETFLADILSSSAPDETPLTEETTESSGTVTVSVS